MKVVLADIDEANLTKAETELKTTGGTVLGVRTDVSKRSDVELLAREALDAFTAASEGRSSRLIDPQRGIPK